MAFVQEGPRGGVGHADLDVCPDGRRVAHAPQHEFPLQSAADTRVQVQEQPYRQARPSGTAPKKKVYLALVQTDGLGIGAWVKPSGGSIPYAWEVSMKFQYMSPAIMEYFYSQATPNDYFVGCLSGSAYMYPKAFPKQWLPKEIDNARRLMDSLDLNVFEIMDYSADKMEAANNELTKEIVDAFFAGMPDAIGFLNGYFASFTFASRGKRPFVSYDYYLSAEKPEDEAASDLEELAAVNPPKRPYFLLVHVRENSDVASGESICDRLGPEFEVVPLDLFLTLAGEQPTFKQNGIWKATSSRPGHP